MRTKNNARMVHDRRIQSVLPKLLRGFEQKSGLDHESMRDGGDNE